jgi:hypothetical protein
MIIGSSQVSFAATHQSESATAVIERTVSQARPLNVRAATAVQRLAVDTVNLSSAAGAKDPDNLQDLTPQQQMAVLVLKALLGQRFQVTGSRQEGAKPGVAAVTNGGAPEVRQRIEFHSESERTTFQAQGVVETTDGRTIAFAANLTLQREFQSYSVSTVAANTTDPLVLNFAGTPVRLTDATISFDLNFDGQKEDIPFVAAGSGFLVLDRNGDGTVNDGSELFGPQTGNGFAELAAHDADGNGWIDSGDPVFADLKIWTQDGLTSLSERGIGAIFASGVDTPFALKDATNALQGNIRSTGVYLSEAGSAGTVQQVDLVSTPA